MLTTAEIIDVIQARHPNFKNTPIGCSFTNKYGTIFVVAAVDSKGVYLKKKTWTYQEPFLVTIDQLVTNYKLIIV